MPTQPDQNELKPGADRFWGQFSQSKAGRSPAEDESNPDEQTGGGPGSTEAGHSESCLEWCPICRSAELFRSAVPPELRQQAESIQHEALGVLKAFLDAYTEKTTGHGPAGPAEATDETGSQPEEPSGPKVTDIPLD